MKMPDTDSLGSTQLASSEAATYELSALIKRLDHLEADRPALADDIRGFRERFVAHKAFQEEVLRNWIVGEQSKGRAIDRVIEAAEARWEVQWGKVLADIGVTEHETSLFSVPFRSWRSLHNVVEKILSPFTARRLHCDGRVA